MGQANVPRLLVEQGQQLSGEAEGVLADLLRSLLGGDAVVAGYRVANQQDDYLVLVAHMLPSRERLVVKLAGPRAPLSCPFERTAALHRLVSRETSVPVAQVLAADTTYSKWPWRYMVKSYVPGIEWFAARPLMDAAALRDAYEQIGRAVAGLHSIRFPGFGQLSDDARVLQRADYVSALTERAKLRLADPVRLERFLRVLHTNARLFSGAAQPCLCHDDLHRHNIIFSKVDAGWRLSAVLDFDSAWAGCAESDLARLELWQGMTGDGFWYGYARPGRPSEGYEQRRPIYQLLWCLEFPSASPEHLATTRAVCDELGCDWPIDSPGHDP